MNVLATVVLYTALAGACIPLGGALARLEHLRPGELRRELLHGIIAFGGGVLLAAVALVLVPHGMAHSGLVGMVAAFTVGAAVFLLASRAIERHGGRAAQLLAMILDFVPEAIALGAAYGGGAKSGPLLALLIGLQNLPEGFNGYRELRDDGQRWTRALAILAALALLGPVAGVAGYAALTDRPEIVAWVMLFAAGGILYLTFEDIAPRSRLRPEWGPPWVPPLGAVAGFLVGMVGHVLLGE